MKQCRQCLQFFALDGFHHDKRSKDGHMSICKSCNKNKVKEWAKNNPDKVKLQSKRQNKELANARSRKYKASEKGKKTEKEYRKKYYAENKDQIKKKLKKWWSENYKTKMPIYSRRHYEKNRDALCLKSSIISKIDSLELSDKYVALVISKSIGVSKELFTQEMIDAKRLHLQIYRLLKEIRNEDTD